MGDGKLSAFGTLWGEDFDSRFISDGCAIANDVGVAGNGSDFLLVESSLLELPVALCSNTLMAAASNLNPFAVICPICPDIAATQLGYACCACSSKPKVLGLTVIVTITSPARMSNSF